MTLVKSEYCCFRGPESGSMDSPQALTLTVTLAPGDTVLSLVSQHQHTSDVCTH